MLPVILGALLFVLTPVALWITRMGAGGQIGRWAAISTIWLLLPVMVGLMLLFIALAAVIYLASRVNAWVPTYSPGVQRLARNVAAGARRGSNMVRKPVLAVKALGDAARTRFRRLRERA